VLGLFVLRELSLSPAAYGAVLTTAGVGSLVGALCATSAARLLGEGTVIVLARSVCALTWVGIALAPSAPDSGTPWATLAVLGVMQLVYGMTMGVEDPSEMGYRQAVTPRAMLGRVNSVLRSANRSMAVLGSLLGGVLATVLDFRTTLLAVAVLFAVAAGIGGFSPLRGARAEVAA
jgi:MFS family permease